MAASVSELLLAILEKLDTKELERFNWELCNSNLKDFPNISKAHLENVTRHATVDRMVETYCDEGAVNVTNMILSNMDLNKLAMSLKRDLPEEEPMFLDMVIVCLFLVSRLTILYKPSVLRAEELKERSYLGLPSQLLPTLEELSTEELRRFQFYLTGGQLPGLSPVPESQLERADWRKTPQKYSPENAVKITVGILRRMNRNDLIEKLERDHRGNTVPVRDLISTTPS
uniref:Uncharacterized LOC115208500 n=1 Tax=Salmo trutta TaxID=8032 RepID=A0A673Z5D9_SALTR